MNYLYPTLLSVFLSIYFVERFYGLIYPFSLILAFLVPFWLRVPNRVGPNGKAFCSPVSGIVTAIVRENGITSITIYTYPVIHPQALALCASNPSIDQNSNQVEYPNAVVTHYPKWHIPIAYEYMGPIYGRSILGCRTTVKSALEPLVVVGQRVIDRETVLFKNQQELKP